MALTALQHPKIDLSPMALLPAPKPKKIRRKKRTDLYQDVTDTVISELEAGRAPWAQPWGIQPKQSDMTIEKIAAARNGDYRQRR